MTHGVAKTAGFFLLFYLGYLLLLFVFQRQMVFPRYLIASPEVNRPGIRGLETVWLPLGADRVEAWYLPAGGTPAQRPGPALIFAHGNGELIDYWALDFERIARDGIGVLLVEFPGYGRSGGSPSQRSVTAAMVAAYDYLTARPEVDPGRIVLLGRSLGGGAVCCLAARRPAAALVLLSTFKSARSFAVRYLAPPFLVRDPFDNLSVVRSFPGPVLVIHGRHDEVIPYSHGRALYRAAARGRMISYDCGHNDCPPAWEPFRRELKSFLIEWGLIPAEPEKAPPGGTPATIPHASADASGG